MALVGNMINDSIKGNPSSINYTMFVSVFSLLSLLYLIPASIRESLAFHPMIMLALDVINAILFFIGGVVLAAKLHVHSCGNYVSRPLELDQAGTVLHADRRSRAICDRTASPTVDTT